MDQDFVVKRHFLKEREEALAGAIRKCAETRRVTVVCAVALDLYICDLEDVHCDWDVLFVALPELVAPS